MLIEIWFYCAHWRSSTGNPVLGLFYIWQKSRFSLILFLVPWDPAPCVVISLILCCFPLFQSNHWDVSRTLVVERYLKWTAAIPWWKISIESAQTPFWNVAWLPWGLVTEFLLYSTRDGVLLDAWLIWHTGSTDHPIDAEMAKEARGPMTCIPCMVSLNQDFRRKLRSNFPFVTLKMLA